MPNCPAAGSDTAVAGRPAHHVTEDHDGLEAELPGDEVELLDRLRRCVHRNALAAGVNGLAVTAERLRHHHVVRAAPQPPHVFPWVVERAQRLRRIHDREVDAELVETLVQETRQRRRREVERLRRRRPEPTTQQSPRDPLVRRRRIPRGLRVRFRASRPSRNRSTAAGPPTSATYSRNTGSGSCQCASASITG